MKNKINNLFNMKLLLFITILFLCILLLSANYSLASATKSKKNYSFSKTYFTLSVGKKIHYQVKHLNKGQFVIYSVSNKKVATIKKKSGWLYSKKPGKIRVKASIYNKGGKKIKTLYDKVTIKKRKSCLPNATFKTKEKINPWNFSLTLTCSRILLKKEVSKSTLTLLPKGKNKPTITANFTKLANNGKDVVYTIRQSHQHSLCPGNSSMNGTYSIQSSLFSKKLTINYTERLTKNTISGFVLQNNGNPIHNAFVNLKTSTDSLHCYTDSNGYYQLTNVKKPLSLTVTKSGYLQKVISSLNISSKGTMCENVILKSSSDTSASLDILVTDTNNNPLFNATIQIFLDSKKASTKQIELSNSSIDTFSKTDSLFCGMTDSTGRLSLFNSYNPKKVSCTKILLNQQMQISYDSSYSYNPSNKKTLSKNTLNSKDCYVIYISNNILDNHSITSYYTKKLYFSFAELDTNHAFLHVQLESCPSLTTNNLSIKWDSDSDISHCTFLDIRLYHRNFHEPFYKKTVTNNNLTITQNNSTLLPTSLPFSLPDDTYYIQLCAKSENGKMIGLSSIESIQVKNGVILQHEINIKQPYYSRILTYADYSDFSFISNLSPSSDVSGSSSRTATFHLYQILNNNYFFINTFTTAPFCTQSIDLQTSNLIVSHLLKDQNYLLYPSLDQITCNSSSLLNIKDKNIYTEESDALLSSTPLMKIQCEILKNPNQVITVPSDFSINTLCVSYNYEYTLDQNTIRLSQTYPNTVIAFYQLDGTLLATSFTSRIIKFPSNLSPKNTSITDFYTNKEILTTNQDSYH